MRATLLKILRRTLYTLLATLAILFAIVQFNQHLLRHRAEALHADILALQLHPGTFADLQRLQARWGAHARYVGPCNIHRCAYYILLSFFSEDTWEKHPDFLMATGRSFVALGGDDSIVTAEVRLRNNQTWFAGFSIMKEGISATIVSGPHLGLNSPVLSANHPGKGFRIDVPPRQIAETVSLTSQTNQDDIRRLATLNFNCLAPWHRCETFADLSPNAWREWQQTSVPEARHCESLETRAREADQVIRATVLSVSTERNPDLFESGNTVTMGGLITIKGATTGMSSSAAKFFSWEEDISRETWKPRQSYLLFLSQNPVGGRTIQLERCAAAPLTPLTQASVDSGITLDTSRGERYPRFYRWLIPQIDEPSTSAP